MEDIKMKYFLTFLLCLIPFSASADWVQYETAENGDVYLYDNSQLHIDGRIITVLNRIKYRSSVMGAKSYESEMRIDCVERTQTITRSTFFNDENWKDAAMAPDTTEKPAVYIEMGSAAASLARLLCK